MFEIFKAKVNEGKSQASGAESPALANLAKVMMSGIKVESKFNAVIRLHASLLLNHKRSYPNQTLTKSLLQTLWNEAELTAEFVNEKREAYTSETSPQPDLPGLSSNPPGDSL